MVAKQTRKAIIARHWRDKWVRVVSATRAWSKGDGWWGIELSCGHKVLVLHGNASPLGERVKCFYKCEEGSPHV